MHFRLNQLVLPRRLQIEFSQVVQAETDRVGLEMTAPQIYALLQREYLQANTPYALVSHRLQEENGNSFVEVEVSGKGQGGPEGLPPPHPSKLWAKLVRPRAARESVKPCTENRLTWCAIGR